MIDTTMNSGSAANAEGAEKPKPGGNTKAITRLSDLNQGKESEENKELPKPKT